MLPEWTLPDECNLNFQSYIVFLAVIMNYNGGIIKKVAYAEDTLTPLSLTCLKGFGSL